MSRPVAAVALLLSMCAGLVIAVSRDDTPPPTRPAAAPRVLPGVQSGGSILLPNQWSLRPAGRQLALGDFPVNLVIHPSGQWLAALHAGYGPHEVVIVRLEPRRQHITWRVTLPQALFGL